MRYPKEGIDSKREGPSAIVDDEIFDTLDLNKNPAMGANSWSAALLFSATFILSVAYNSQIMKFAGDHTFEYVNRSFYVTALFGIILGIVLGELLASFAAITLFLYFGAMAIVGSSNGSLGLINSIFLPYAPLAIAPLAAYLMRQRRGNFIEVTIKIVASIYFLLYIYFSFKVSGDVSRTKSGGGFVVASGGRGARLVIDAAAVTAAYFLALAGIRSGRQIPFNGLVLTLGCAVLYLSDSRLLIATMAIFTILFVAMPTKRIIDYCAVAVFIAISGIMLLLLTGEQNIYEFFRSDNSALARMQELNSIQRALDQNIIIGHGFFIPGSLDPTKAIDYDRDIFWNDMGIYGVLFATGIVGLLIYIPMSVSLILSRKTLSAAGQPDTLVNGLGLACIACGMLGFSAPLVWTNGLELVALILAAFTVARTRARI